MDELDSATFQKIARIAYSQGGIVLKDGKQALVASRVQRRQRALGFSTIRQDVRHLEADTSVRRAWDAQSSDRRRGGSSGYGSNRYYADSQGSRSAH
jgi:hypothetical protein